MKLSNLRAIAAASLALAFGVGSFSAANAASITGGFAVTSGTPDILVAGDEGGTLSNHGKTLNVDLGLTLSPNTPVAESLFGVPVFSISTLNTAFTGLSDGSAAISCTGNCQASGFEFLSTISLNPSSFTVDFADGATLQIDDFFNPERYESYTFDYTPGASGVPEPLSLSLLGLGLAGVGFTGLRRKALAA